jgi:hypothetical protein
MNTRRFHGLLTAATKPPVGWMVLLSRLEKTIVVMANASSFRQIASQAFCVRTASIIS